MAHIDISTARRLAIDRVITVLRGQYATELAAIKDTGLLLPAPADTDYYTTSPDDPETDNLLHNSDVAVIVWQAGARQLGDIFTGGATTRAQTGLIELDILVLFRSGFHEPLTTNGHALSEYEYMQLRAERYAGALITTLYKYAVEADSVHDIELVSDEAQPIHLQDRPVIGVATTRWRVTQKLAVPQKRPLP